MSEFKTVKEVETDYSNSQIYWRIDKLVESGLMDPPERGERNQYLLDSNDLRLLKDLAELEMEDDTVKEAIEKLKEEEGRKTERVQSENVKELENKVQELENRVELLEDQLLSKGERTKKFKENWREQLRGSLESLKDMFE
jgi:DNA-binding transcriptional MerR regulator